MSTTQHQLGSVSIDVDSTVCYRQIHGLPFREDEADPIYEKALPRFLQAMAKFNIKATLFVIGRDLENAFNRKIIAQAAADGHEIANHSYLHDYALSRLPQEDMRNDVRKAHVLIQEITGQAPVGFRAPGYNQSEALFDVLEDLGYQYDSSFFPTPAYFAARATAIGMYQLKNKTSHSLVGEMREFLVPPEPFFPMRNIRFKPAKLQEHARRILEVPISVAGPARLPWLGTTLVLAPDRIGQMMTRSVLRRKKPAILELHAIDFADPQDGFEEALQMAQSDLKVPLQDKLRRLDHTFQDMASHRHLVPMKNLVQSLSSVCKEKLTWLGTTQPVS